MNCNTAYFVNQVRLRKFNELWSRNVSIFDRIED